MIDLRKLRFWHNVHSAVLISCSELVWDVLCKQTVKNLLTVYDANIIYNFIRRRSIQQQKKNRWKKREKQNRITKKQIHKLKTY